MKDRTRRTTSRVKMRARTLFKAVFGRIVAYEKLFVFQTDTSKVRFSTENKAGFTVKLANSDDVQRLDRFAKFRRGEAEKRLKDGNLCFVVLKEGNLAGYAWISFHEAYVPELEGKIRLGPDSAYRYDVFAVPAYRGMGVFRLIFEKSGSHLYQKGIREIISLVDSDNFNSLRALQRVGNAPRRIGEVTTIRLFNSRRHTLKADRLEDYKKLTELFSRLE
jgi:GNAT superfamily N-acetyltransferase